MSTFIKDFVDGCATCQSTKVLPRTCILLKPNQIPTEVWSIITMDFITDLPLSNGFDSLFVVIDRLSKATILSPCNKTITAKGTSSLYLSNVWKRTGLPQQVVSDWSPQFASKVMREIWSKLGVKSTMSTAFHPQTDSKTKWVDQELEQYLHIFCNFQVNNWADLNPFHGVCPQCPLSQCYGSFPIHGVVWPPTWIHPPHQFCNCYPGSGRMPANARSGSK